MGFMTFLINFDYLTKIINDQRNLMLLGDINIHYEDKEDLDKQAFEDLLKTFRLKQWVSCITQVAGHMHMQINRDVHLSEQELCWKLSDQWLIKTSLKEHKPNYEKKNICFCKTKKLENEDTKKQHYWKILPKSAKNLQV